MTPGPREARDVAARWPDRLRTLLTRAHDGVWVTTLNGRIVFWNRAAETVLGYRARDVLGRGCADVLTGLGDYAASLCGIGCDSAALVAPDGFERAFDLQTRAADGRRVWLDVTVCGAGDGHASPPLVVHVFREVTRTKELVRALRERLGRPSRHATRLTPRELEVLRVMAQGLGTKAAAARLHVSRATIRNHVQNIFTKLGVHTRLEAVLHATRGRLL